jgi:hypothetical protein
MKHMPLATIVLAASTIFTTAAYAEIDHKHDAPKPEAGASHETNCCKPDPKDIKWIHEGAEHQHEHARAPKKPAAKKSARKSARAASRTEK